MEELQNNFTDGYWSDAIDSDEMKAFLKKNYKIDIKYLLILLMLFAFALITFISGNEEQSTLALALPQLTGKISDTVLRLLGACVFFALFMIITNRKDAKHADGTIESVTVGSAPDPEAPSMVGLMRRRVPRYDVMVRGDDGKQYIMETLDKDIAYMYQEGEPVRFHTAFSYIEKYRKSEDDVLYCPNCKRKFSEEVEVCGYCGCPQLR